MGEDDSCDVRVVNELIHQSNSCVVNDNDSVVALVSDLK